MTTASIHIIASPESWIEQSAIDQLHQTAALPDIDAVVGLPDLHAGRGIAVGAAFTNKYKDNGNVAVALSMVGNIFSLIQPTAGPAG